MTPPMREKARVMDADAMRRALARMAHEILEHNKSAQGLVIVGIRTRGLPLAQRLARAIGDIEQTRLDVGTLDVSGYRDDRPGPGSTGGPRIASSAVEGPVLSPAEEHSVPLAVAGKTIIVVDDVLYTGRTVRAAMDALIDLGRPGSIQLAVLVDRGHRELPIRPDYVGKNLPTSAREHVAVRLVEVDGVDEVVIEEPTDGNAETRKRGNVPT